MALLDILKQRKQQLAGATQASDILKQQQMRATGKEVAPTTGPAMSNVQAQLAAGMGQAQQKQAGFADVIGQQSMLQQESAQTDQFNLQAKQQQAGFGQQKQNIAAAGMIDDLRRQATEEQARAQLINKEQSANKQLTNSYAEALKNMANERGITEQDIFMEAARSREELGVAKTGARLDQLAHIAAMSDTAYIDTIKRIGQERRLDDELNFRQESARTAFGYDMQILGKQFDMNALINADERESRMILANIDINTAIQLAQQAVKEEAFKSIITGTTTFVSAYNQKD